MIGGIDCTIPTQAGQTALDMCVRLARHEWPSAVFEDAATGAVFESYELLPIGRLSELFIYRDRAAAKAWDDLGAHPSLSNTMIHMLLSPTTLTVVVDDPSSEPMAKLRAAIRRGLQMDILNLRAEVRRAA